MNTDMTADNILKQLLEKSVDLTEVLKSREVLKTAGGTVLAENHKDINQKTRTKIELAVKDVVEGVKILKEKKMMPLVLAAPDQWRRCPGAGLTSKTAPGLELEAKVESLEKCMTDFIESNKKQMEALTAEVKKTVEIKKTTVIPEITVAGTPVKKRKVSEISAEVEYSTPVGGLAEVRPLFSQVAMAGVQPLHPPGRKAPSTQPVTQQMMQKAVEDAIRQNKEKTKGKSVFRGSSAEAGASSLSADVDLVASGVAKDASAKQLEDYLKAKGIDVVTVECLTKQELVTELKVRSKTFKVTVKAAHHEKAMDPGVWPFRVGVRHYRAPQRAKQGAGEGSWASQSAQAGGRLEDGAWQRQAEGGLGKRQQPRGFKNPSRRQQQISQPVLNMLNMWAGLGEQPAP